MIKAMKGAKRRATIAALERKVMELEAQLAHTYRYARAGLANAGRDKCKGSAVIVSVNALGGTAICKPFALVDGMSQETINALIVDIGYSYERATEIRP